MSLPTNKLIVFLIVFVLLAVGSTIFSLGLYDGFYKPYQQQHASKIYNVTVFHAGGIYERAISGLRDKMEESGYIEGKNINYNIIDLKGDIGRIDEYFSGQPSAADLYYTISTPVTKKVWESAGSAKPIVFNIVGDPIGAGFAKEYRSSENNLTGCSNSSAELSGKRLEIFKEAFPQIKKIVTIYDPSNSFSILSIKNTREAARVLGIEVAEIQIGGEKTLASALGEIVPGKYDGFYITPDAVVVSNIDQVLARTGELKLPTMGHEDSLADKGATLIYGADFYDLGRQCAAAVGSVLRGNEPKMIPIMTPAKFEIVINQKSCEEIGLFPAPSILGRSDHIIK